MAFSLSTIFLLLSGCDAMEIAEENDDDLRLSGGETTLFRATPESICNACTELGGRAPEATFGGRF